MIVLFRSASGDVFMLDLFTFIFMLVWFPAALGAGIVVYYNFARNVGKKESLSNPTRALLFVLAVPVSGGVIIGLGYLGFWLMDLYWSLAY